MATTLARRVTPSIIVYETGQRGYVLVFRDGTAIEVPDT